MTEERTGKGKPMTDDTWRRDDEEDEPLFGEHEPTRDHEAVDDGLTFGASDTGSLPHWTEPPTGELPRLGREGDVVAADGLGDDDELDVWSSFTSESPVWKDDSPTEPGPDAVPGVRRTGQHDVVPGEHDITVPREPSRITIGTDPSGMPRRPPVQTGRRRGGQPAGRPVSSPRAGSQPSNRNMPVATAVGVLIAAVFVAALLWRPLGVIAMVTVILALAAVEFYDRVTEKGYRPAVVPGIAACVAAPLATYWIGERAIPIVITFGFMAASAGFIGGRSIEAGPMPNASITTLGIIWIGLLGSFAALILRFSTIPGSPTWGTDTLFLLALGVVANDIGALFVGSAAGRTPLRAWISPHKTVEGFIGGALLTIVALVVVGIGEWSDTWTSRGHLLLLAIVISIMAPMGDLVESMFKRNLDVKDFGSIIKGHGGVLDRFDGFLFTLPAVYYLSIVLEPWTA
jgi:phosphatidate cytidylyltransferase